MFRRKRSVSHGPINPNPSQSAQTAAAQAFRASQGPNNANLSSSAAAAALRKHTTSPTSVEDVETKRMVQRRQSTASISTSMKNPRRAQNGGGGGGLRRVGSSGSMTARTFRERSPAHGSSAGRSDEPIIVPPIPHQYTTASTVSNHRRGRSGSDTQYRAISPPTHATRNQRKSVDQISSPRTGSIVSSQGGATSPVSTLERRGSLSSVNFSYPMNARPNSPYQSLNTTSTISPEPEPRETDPIMRPVLESVEEGGKISSPQEAGRDELGTQPNPLHVEDSPSTSNGLDNHESTPWVGEESLVTSEKIRTARISSPTGMPYPADTLDLWIPKRKPSTIRESHEPEVHAEDELVTQRQLNNESPLIPADTAPSNGSSKHTSPISGPSGKNRSRHTTTSPEQSADPLYAPTETHVEERRSPRHLPDHLQNDRPHSLSPSRSTRFSDHLEIVKPGNPLHQPPPRSKSPAKSALKASTSTRGVSSGRSTPQYARTDAPSETSEGTSVLSDEGSKAGWKRKTAKVSFEDDAQTLSAITSPPTSPESAVPSSPRFERTYYSGRDGHMHGDEADEVIKPRPVLPCFGSVRGRKTYAERDKTRRPHEDSARLMIGNGNHGESFSSDHAVAGLLKANPRQNTETDPNEPLPPEVTSVEGSGYESMSDDLSSEYSEAGRPRPVDYFASEMASEEEVKTGQPPEHDGSGPASALGKPHDEVSVPAIAVQPATPKLENQQLINTERGRIPGAFPSSTRVQTAGLGEENLTKETGPQQSAQSTIPSRTITTTTDDAGTDGDSGSDSGESIYSDAAEDLSELEGDGYGSINAIMSHGSYTDQSSAPTRSNQHDMDSTVDSVKSTSPEPLTESSKQPVSGNEHAQLQSKTIPLAENLPPRRVVSQPGTHAREQSQSIPEAEKVSAVPRRSVTNGAGPKPQKEKPIRLESIPSTKERGRTKPAMNHDHANHGIPENTLHRSLSNGSDSSSSFKRAKQSAPRSGRYKLRQTMRGMSVNSMTVSPVDRPPQGHRPQSADAHSTVLRPTLRGPGSGSTQKPSGFSILKRSPTPQQSLRKNREAGSGFKSRIPDSSDDEPDMKLTPVRGIPRRKNKVDGDSTELEDSSDGGGPDNVVRRKSRHAQGNPQTIAASLASSSKPTNKLTRGGAGPKHAESSYLPPYNSNAKPKTGTLRRLGLSKRNRGDDDTRIRKSALDSAARRDTPLERQPAQLEQIRNEKLDMADHATPGTITSITGASSPKTKKNWRPFSPRHKPGGKLSRQPEQLDEWPLQNSGTRARLPPLNTSARKDDKQLNHGLPSFSGNDRPHTADGVHQPSTSPPTNVASPTADREPARKSRFFHRHQSRHGPENGLNVTSPASDIGPSFEPVAPGGGSRKGKFSKLRSALGLKS